MQSYVLRRSSDVDPVGIYPSRNAAQAVADADSQNDYVISECPVVPPEPLHRPGTIGWVDLTVEDATAVASFYENVVGWSTSSVPVGDYHDYCLAPNASADPVAGLCHAKGANSNLPTAWLIYVTVEDLDAAVAACDKHGGTVLQNRPADSYGRIAVIQDPNGVALALFQPAKQAS